MGRSCSAWKQSASSFCRQRRCICLKLQLVVFNLGSQETPWALELRDTNGLGAFARDSSRLFSVMAQRCFASKLPMTPSTQTNPQNDWLHFKKLRTGSKEKQSRHM